MFGWFWALTTATFSGLCVYGLVRSRRALAEDLRVRSVVEGVTETKIRAATPGRVHITGRVSGRNDASVEAPFTGTNALWVRSSIKTNVGQVVESWVRRVETIVVDDRSGSVAHVDLEGANVRMREAAAADPGRTTAFMNEVGRSPGSGEFTYEAVLAVGDVVSVVGTAVEGTGDYRTSAGPLVIDARAGEVIVFDPAVEGGEPDRHRSYVTLSIIGIIGFALATIALVVNELR